MEFTRYQLRKQAEDLKIKVSYPQFAKYIRKGLLPDPNEVPWIKEEIVPRFLRIHELDATVRSLDRRVVVLYLERYPVPVPKLRNAMVGMLPTIKTPARKMARVTAAGNWFGKTHGEASALGKGERLPIDWTLPAPSKWGNVLTEADLDVFTNRLGIAQYYGSLLTTLGKGTPYALGEIVPEEKLVLFMVEYLAGWLWFQEQARNRAQRARAVLEEGRT